MLKSLLNTKKIIVCLGAGGVGKTTVSAALSLLSCQMGKKTLLLTIDPAKRLANALGLNRLHHEPRQVIIPSAVAKKLNLKTPLYAMALDMQAAWDDLVRRLSSNQSKIESIFNNRFYRHLSCQVAGSHELVAAETLYTLFCEQDYDVIILDTPPTVHALDFLDAPERVLSFLSEETFGWLSRQQKKWFSFFNLWFLRPTSFLARTWLQHFISVRFLNELMEFLSVFSHLYPHLQKRAKEFSALMASSQTGFLAILAPDKNAVHEALILQHGLNKRRLIVEDFIVNRVLPGLPSFLRQLPSFKMMSENLQGTLLADFIDEALYESLCSLAENKQQDYIKQEELLADFESHLKKLAPCKIVKLPFLSEEMGSIESLGFLLEGSSQDSPAP